ncbi:putative hydrolase of the HAD superfamily [Filimonas zeae]|uniref:Hydrolase of the HAD superfamily n=1 Tax=Filimonas zeae TaxID=1737353 RepID=A0A917J1Y4_9BACT|nr:HAD family hydrolase [Filimonas zeae]MDR6339992.1 putative hydrolase of the HAD superfamily [Filimonas zeae]GGH70623.1 hypothetical protein GCM10011379_29100 [Filimonas zeae]
MPVYKHYSFDLWLTLIRSNPAFKAERAVYFHRHLNSMQKTLEEVKAIFRQVDLMCNAINEKTGNNIDAEEMYLMVISLLNPVPGYLQQIDTAALYREMEQLVFNYMPGVYSADTLPALQTLCEQGGCTLNILSNTGFIKGSTLRQVLQHIQLDRYFNFQLYSDEWGMSKPNQAFFVQMIQKAGEHQLQAGIAAHEIIHIGDNPLADIQGAQAAGIHSLLINSNHLTISNLMN